MILQVFNKYLQMGGEEKSVERIRKHAIEAGISVQKCFFDSADWQGEGSPSKLAQLRKLFYNHDSAAKIDRAIDEHQPNALLLHNIYPVGSPAILDVAMRRKVPVIQYVHNFRPFSVGGTLYAKGHYCESSLDGDFKDEVIRGAWQGSVLKSAIMAKVLKKVQKSGWLENVSAWICISEYMAEAFARAGIPENKLHVLRHSWDVSSEHNIQKDLGYYLFLGRLTEEKGIAILLETWKLLRNQLGENTPKLMIGGDGPLRNLVEATAKSDKFIEYRGLVEGEVKANLIGSCRAMLAPSIWKEPLGLVTYEAQDYSRAIFASRSGGLAETTVNGVTGFLHEPGNVNELTSQLVDYESASDDYREKIGVAARKYIELNAASSQWKKDFLDIIDSVISPQF